MAVRLEPDQVHQGATGDGIFRFDGLLPGVYEAVMISEAGDVDRRTARVYAGLTSVLSVEVSRGASR